MVNFVEATLKNTKSRYFIFGPSGFGKSTSALRIARGLISDKEKNPWGKIAMIDTEHGRGQSCVGRKVGKSKKDVIGPFHVAQIAAPFTVAKYVSAMYDAAKSGHEVLIIDSISHLWAGKGGLLEQKDEVHKSNSNRDQRSDWAPVTADYLEFIEAMHALPIHLICTCRSKNSWITQYTDDGKAKLLISGEAPVMRSSFEYEFGVILHLAEKSIVQVLKDDFSIYGVDPFTPTESSGCLMRNYLANLPVGEIQTSPEYQTCTCGGLMVLDGVDEVVGKVIRIFRCKSDPKHVRRVDENGNIAGGLKPRKE